MSIKAVCAKRAETEKDVSSIFELFYFIK